MLGGLAGRQAEAPASHSQAVNVDGAVDLHKRKIATLLKQNFEKCIMGCTTWKSSTCKIIMESNSLNAVLLVELGIQYMHPSSSLIQIIKELFAL